MPQRPTVTVITVSFNGWTHLSACLPSLLTQDYPADRVEIIVVDNGSRDGSAEKVRARFPGVRVIENKTNAGFATANNQGARAATGTYLALINNDMRARPDWLSQLVATAERTGAACVAGTILDWTGAKIEYNRAGVDPYGGAYHGDAGAPAANLADEPRDREIIFACAGALLVDRAVFLDAGGFDDDFFAYAEDVDLGWRLWILGHRVVRGVDAVAFHRFRGTSGRFSSRRRDFHIDRNTLALLYKNYDERNHIPRVAGALLLRSLRTLQMIWQPPAGYAFTDPPPPLWRRAAARAATIVRVAKKLDRIAPQLAAAGAFALMLPRLKEKRRAIQVRRVRSDAEIAPLLCKREHYFKDRRFRELFDAAFDDLPL